MQVYTQRRRRYNPIDRMADHQDPMTEPMDLLRELNRNQRQISETQRLMQETLQKLAEGKTTEEQNGYSDDSVLGRTNFQPSHSRPSIPIFLPKTEAPHKGREPTFEEMQEKLQEDWRNANMEGDISYRDYVDLRMRYFGGGNCSYFNDDLRRKIGKVNLLPFDGFGVITAQSCVLNADTYFQLNPKPKKEAIKFATLHLEGVAHEWWHHGLVTLGHNQVTSYIKFTERLIHLFDRKDPELNFKDLAQLKQTGTVDNYVTEFQRLSVLVIDISERRRIVLFMDGLRESLRG